jgi:hypothetical protein
MITSIFWKTSDLHSGSTAQNNFMNSRGRAYGGRPVEGSQDGDKETPQRPVSMLVGLNAGL